ncbi:MFS transporter [Plastoroseomonas hellenica]|uniref:MFS transporter n=1 Tax=Plastoroseomonas hellenica TaxID=2687306 RepID=UPI001BAB2800|nr:MFS transporter [Plastoroseomonas hellenica]MBR0645414.1 MFS transporter [Plastoroseomonas hellenica]
MPDSLSLGADMAPAAAAERAGAAWAAVVSLALGVFGLVTAEFLPASLLTPIAADLAVSDGTAGQTVTATALVAAVAAPLVVLGTARIDRRLVVWGLSLLLLASNLMAAFATHVVMLLAARVLLGVALGGFWALAAALAMRLVPPRLLPRAMSIIFTGVSLATVCAAPVGAFLGDLWGWRAVFLAAGVIGAVALVIQVATMPKLPPVAASGAGGMLGLFRRPGIRIGLVVVMFVISGHFAGFTYTRPFLEQVPRLSVEMMSLVLLAFGVGGFFGNLAGGLVAERSARMAVGLGALLLVGAAFALLGFGTSQAIAFAALAAWGFAFGMLPVGLQTWNTRAAGQDAEAAGALLVTAFQVAIATGAILGGLLVDGFGAMGAIAYCGLAVLAGAFLMLGLGRGREVRVTA